MIICSTEFEILDPKNPDYSMCEVDFYSHLPYGSGFPQHRLTLRKCLKTGEYEAVRVYQQRHLISRKGLTVDTGKETGQVEVAFKSKSLAETLVFMNGEVKRFWKHDREPDKPCEHRPPNLHYRCRIWKELSTEEKMKAYKKDY